MNQGLEDEGPPYGPLRLFETALAYEETRVIWKMGHRISPTEMADSLFWFPVEQTVRDLQDNGQLGGLELPSAYRDPVIGLKGHGWEPGVYPSPYANDDEFVLVVFRSGYVIRFSKYTPEFVLSLYDIVTSMQSYRNKDIGDIHLSLRGPFKMLAVQHYEVDHHRIHMPDPEIDLVIENLVTAFSHEARPRRAMQMLEAAAHWNPGTPFEDQVDTDALEKWGIHTYPTWCRAVVEGIRNVFETTGWIDNLLSDHEEVSQFGEYMCGLILDGFVQKMHPGYSLGYQFNTDHDTVPIERIIGKEFEWSNGRRLPYAAKECRRAAALSIFLIHFPILEWNEVDPSKLLMTVFKKGTHAKLNTDAVKQPKRTCVKGAHHHRLPKEVAPLIATFAWGADPAIMKEYIQNQMDNGNPILYSRVTDVQSYEWELDDEEDDEEDENAGDEL